MHTSPLFGFPPHLGQHRALRRIPWSYTVGSHQSSLSHAYTSVPVSGSAHPPSPSWCHTLPLCLCFCFANKIINTIFFRFHIYPLIYDIFPVSGVTFLCMTGPSVSKHDPVPSVFWLVRQSTGHVHCP